MLLRYDAILRRKPRAIVLTPPHRGMADPKAAPYPFPNTELYVAAFATSGSIEKRSFKYVAR